MRVLQRYDPRNADIVYWVNGVLRHRDEPGISPFDSVVQGGDAVWEGLRLYSGRVYGLDAHLGRLRHSALALGFTDVPSAGRITEALVETLRANGMTDGVHIRLTLTRGVKVTSGMDPRLNQGGPTLIVLPEFKEPVYDPGGVRLVTAGVRRPGPDVLDPKIHHNNLLNSILAKIEANVAGADDALMLDGRGFVAETNATNLFAQIDGRLCTPRAVACPEGITRATVLRLAALEDRPVDVRDISLAEMYGADEVFCTGTMGEVVPVVSTDGRETPAGPVTAHLAVAYREYARRYGTVVVTP